MLDTEMLASGHADPDTGKIGIQHPWCNTLQSYLRHPGHASEEELWSLAMFTHESMHVRGELNEARTECEAVQRNYRAAKLLGVADAIAKRNALDYYNIIYRERGKWGTMQAQYYSDECAPGKSLDEHLSDSTWADTVAIMALLCVGASCRNGEVRLLLAAHQATMDTRKWPPVSCGAW